MGGKVDPAAAALVDAALARQLVVFSGAGLSVAPPTELPLGTELARDAEARIGRETGQLPAHTEGDLRSLADAMDAAPGGAEVLRSALARSADFDGAAPNHAHSLLAALIDAGVIDALTSNWDTCVERTGHRVRVVIEPGDAATLAEAGYYKVHGCVTKPRTMLVSSTELKSPPMLAGVALGTRLLHGVVVFVGVGDVADYAVETIEAIVTKVADVGRVRVVGPNVVREWNGSEWAKIKPEVPPSGRVEMSAEAFLDELACAYLLRRLGEVSEKAELLGPDAAEGVSRLLAALGELDAETAMSWLATIVHRRRPGTETLGLPTTQHALLALGVQIDKRGAVSIRDRGLTLVGSEPLRGIAGALTPTRDLIREVERLVTDDINNGEYDPRQEVTVIVAGELGPPPPIPAVQDAGGNPDSADIVNGALLPRIRVVSAAAITGQAA